MVNKITAGATHSHKNAVRLGFFLIETISLSLYIGKVFSPMQVTPAQRKISSHGEMGGSERSLPPILYHFLFLSKISPAGLHASDQKLP